MQPPELFTAQGLLYGLLVLLPSSNSEGLVLGIVLEERNPFLFEMPLVHETGKKLLIHSSL